MKQSVDARVEVIEYIRAYAITCKDTENPFVNPKGTSMTFDDAISEIRSGTDWGKNFYYAWERVYEKSRM